MLNMKPFAYIEKLAIQEMSLDSFGYVINCIVIDLLNQIIY